MEKGFCLGIAVGMIAGALVCANSKKVRNFVLQGQSKVTEKIKNGNSDRQEEQNQD